MVTLYRLPTDEGNVDFVLMELVPVGLLGTETTLFLTPRSTVNVVHVLYNYTLFCQFYYFYQKGTHNEDAKASCILCLPCMKIMFKLFESGLWTKCGATHHSKNSGETGTTVSDWSQVRDDTLDMPTCIKEICGGHRSFDISQGVPHLETTISDCYVDTSDGNSSESIESYNENLRKISLPRKINKKRGKCFPSQILTRR